MVRSPSYTCWFGFVVVAVAVVSVVGWAHGSGWGSMDRRGSVGRSRAPGTEGRKGGTNKAFLVGACVRTDRLAWMRTLCWLSE